MDAVASSTFASLLRHYRLAAGLTQEELAERANLSVRGVSDLERGLRTSPRSETVDLLAAALALTPEDRAELDAAISRRRGPGIRPARRMLPAESTSLVGRADDAARAVQLLRGDVRLLTLTGPGGVGKTRLALRVARLLEGEFTAGAAFVSLASIRNPALVPNTVASALGFRQQRGQSSEELLIAQLKAEECLLVLDNFEHLLAAAPLVSRLLAACPRLTTLVTSRSPLHLQAEWEMEVGPLAVPPSVPLPGSALRFPAVTLFLERARAVKLDFQGTEDSLPVIARICRDLDGLPLAIELAAAHVKVLSPEALLARLEQRLPLLTGGPRDLPTRQQTMRDTIAWSYDLLSPDEQTLFRRLAVFAGGCTEAAADTVFGSLGRLEITTLAGLESLVDKSLLRVQGAASDEGMPRFIMLETIREFALAELLSGPEAKTAFQEHARFYLSVAEDAERELRGQGQEAWLNRLAAEHQNFRAALRRMKRTNDIESGLRLVSALSLFWSARGHLEEARTWLDTFLATSESPTVSDSVRARALFVDSIVSGTLHGHNERSLSALNEALSLAHRAGDDATAAAALWDLGMQHHATADFRRGEELLTESLTRYRRMQDRTGVCAVLVGLAVAPRYQGDFERATAIYTEALGIARDVGDIRRLAEILAKMGNMESERGRPELSAPFYEEALAIYRRLGDQFGTADIMLRSAETAIDLGEFADAWDLLEECLPIFRSHGVSIAVAHAQLYQGEAALGMGDLSRAQELGAQCLDTFIGVGDRRFAADSLCLLADVASAQQDLARALSLYRQSLAAHHELNTRPFIAQCLERMLLLAVRQRLAERAARLHGAARSLHAAMGSQIAPTNRERYNRALVAACEQLGREAFAAEVVVGEAMTPDQSVAYALDWQALKSE